jgi:hypothetical protein
MERVIRGVLGGVRGEVGGRYMPMRETNLK